MRAAGGGMKRINPYQRLLEICRRFSAQIIYPIKKGMFFYEYKRLGEGWDLSMVYQRTKAAEQVGFEVIVEAHDNGLQFCYRKKPDIPWELK